MFVASLALVLGMAPAVFAADFSTDEYKVKLNVSDDSSAYITEDISVDIHQPMHGIYRYIPLSRRVEYKADGKPIQQSYAAMQIDDVSVDIDPYKVYTEKGNIVIRIGSEDKYVDGKKDYSLSYRVHMYKDDSEKYDTFYYNVLPFGWETPIKNSKVTLAMPKSFEKKNVDVLVGEKGDESHSDAVKWTKKGNTLIIETKEELPKGSGITVGIKLPEGYFDGAPTHTMFTLIMYAIGGLFIAAMILLWLKFGKDPRHVQTVEFYPPEDITSAEVGYIIDGHVDKEDVVSLLFDFARRGLISISEEGKNDYILTKEQELPPTAKTYERVFFDGLFESGSSVKFSGLQDSFYDTYTSTREMIGNEFKTGDSKIFRSKANVIRGIAFLLPPLAAGVMAWMMWRTFGSVLLMAASILVILLTIIGYIMGMYIQDREYTKGRAKKVMISAGSLVMVVLAMLITVWIAVSVLGNWIMAILFAAVLGMGYFATRFMRSRTRRGAEMLGKILGFREFIRVAEKDRLEKLVEENPQYYFDVMPYAYVLGLSKKWAKKFEGIAIEQPNWYRGSYHGGGFNSWIFYSSMNDFGKYASASIKIPSADVGGSSFGSSGGGGGFSVGGGFGGGGGGGW